MKTFLLFFLTGLVALAQGNSSIDPRRGGRHNDGSDEGAINARLVEGEIVWRKFRNLSSPNPEVTGLGTSATFQGGAIFNSPIDTSGAFLVTVAQLTEAQITTGGTNGTQGAIIRVPFYGRDFGVAMQRLNTTRDFAIKVDGWTKRVHPQFDYLTGRSISYAGDPDSRLMVFTGLPDSLHIAEIIFDASQTASSTWTLYGYGVEKRSGYQPEIVGATALASQTLTTSDAQVNGSIPSVAASYSSISMNNTSGSAVQVTNKINSIVFGMNYLAAAGSAGDSATITFPVPVVPTGANNNFTMACSANSAVKIIVWGIPR